jgi:hypothetical protein
MGKKDTGVRMSLQTLRVLEAFLRAPSTDGRKCSIGQFAALDIFANVPTLDSPQAFAPSARAGSQHAMRIARRPSRSNSDEIGTNPTDL